MIAGLAHAAVVIITHDSARVLLHIALLCVATLALFVGLASTRRYLFVRGRVYFALADRSSRWASGSLDHLRLSQRIFNLPLRIVSGVAYGAIVGAAAFVLPGAYTSTYEQISFSIFLFFSNSLTGMALYALVQFFAHGRILFDRLAVNMWSSENDSTRILLGLSRRLSLAAIVYVSLSMTSILFSNFLIGPIIIAYVIFSVSTILFVAMLPYAAVLRRLVEQKRAFLRSLARTIESNTRALLEGRANEQVLVSTRQLVELKRWAEETSYFPLRLSSFKAFASVTLISILPVVVDWLLRNT